MWELEEKRNGEEGRKGRRGIKEESELLSRMKRKEGGKEGNGWRVRNGREGEG